MREDEQDLGFAEFGDSKRLHPSPTERETSDGTPDPAEFLVGRQGLEPWTLGLKVRCSAN